MTKRILSAAMLVMILGISRRLPAQADSTISADSSHATKPLNRASANEIATAYQRLIDSENSGDIAAIKELVWNSPSLLFVGKTPADQVAEKGNWAGFWGDDAVKELQGIVQSHFKIVPDYSRVKTVGISKDVAETYAPVQISVSFAGQTPIPRPFLQVVTWIKTPKGWRMATDIAIPIPAAPVQSKQ